MNHRGHPWPPAARTEGLLFEQVGDEAVVYDLESKEAHALSPIAAAVFAASDGRRTVSELGRSASERLGVEVTEEQVWAALVQLEESGLLEPPKGGISRRDLVRKSAVAALAVPLVTSIVLPSGAYAATSCHIGAACTSDADCPKLAQNLPTDQRCYNSATSNPWTNADVQKITGSSTATAGNLNDAKTCRCYTGTTFTGTCWTNSGPIQGAHTFTHNTCQFV